MRKLRSREEERFSPVGCKPPEGREFFFLFLFTAMNNEGFSGGLDGKESACNVGDPGLIPRLGRSTREGNGYPLQHSFLENPMDRGDWGATLWQHLTHIHH